MKSYTLRPDIFTLNFNLLFQVRSVVHEDWVQGLPYMREPEDEDANRGTRLLH